MLRHWDRAILTFQSRMCKVNEEKGFTHRMPFPEAHREVYQRNPLAEVVAQLRFAPIVRTEAEPPGGFQDAIRENYPMYRASAAVPFGMPQPVQRMMQELGAPDGLRQYTFGSNDRNWEVILTRESLVLKTKAYAQWQDFEARLRQVRAGFERAYQPVSSYTSLNLRYVDIIQRSRLGLENQPWSALLTPGIAGELSSPEIGADIDKMTSRLHCRVDEHGSFVTLSTGLILAKDGSRESSFLIDSDFHTHTETAIPNVDTTFQRFNKHARNLFQWAIQRRLREALQPVVIA